MNRFPNVHGQLANSYKWKCYRLLSIGTVLICLYTLLFIHVNVNSDVKHHLSPAPDASWINFDPDDSRLIDQLDFSYIMQPKKMCHYQRDKVQTYFIIYVHSAPRHFQERETIRSTWGSVESIGNWSVRVIFLVGLTTDSLQQQLLLEHDRYDDIVQGNFLDSYRNLSYKHLMGYKWILSHCPDVKFIVKADDDAFIDVVQLFVLLNEMYMIKSSKLSKMPQVLACSVWPDGSAPQRLPNHKWTVSVHEYSKNVYPAYCGGLAYVVSPSAALELLNVSKYVPFFWIDDLYVTGILAEKVPDLRHHALNLRTTYDSNNLISWLWEPSLHTYNSRPCPYIFGDVNNSKNRFILLHNLWAKTKSVWKNMAVAYKYR